jgi:hypothetical protein
MNPPSFQNMTAPPVSAPVSAPQTVGGGNPIYFNPMLPLAGDQTLGNIAQRIEEQPKPIDEPVEAVVVESSGDIYKFPKKANYKPPVGKMWNFYTGRPIAITTDHPQRDLIFEFNITQGYIRNPEEI